MITPVYESFVNNIACELFGLSQKEKDIKEMNNLPDKDLGRNTAINVCIQYENTNKDLLKKYNGTDGVLKELIRRTIVYVKDRSSIDLNDLGWKCIAIQPIFYSEILESGNIQNRKNVKTRASGYVDTSSNPVMYGIELNTDELNKDYPNNGLPRFMIFEPYLEFAFPVFDKNIGIMCIYNKSTGSITHFVMTNRDLVLKDAHSGHLKTTGDYLDYFEKKIK